MIMMIIMQVTMLMIMLILIIVFCLIPKILVMNIVIKMIWWQNIIGHSLKGITAQTDLNFFLFLSLQDIFFGGDSVNIARRSLHRRRRKKSNTFLWTAITSYPPPFHPFPPFPTLSLLCPPFSPCQNLSHPAPHHFPPYHTLSKNVNLCHIVSYHVTHCQLSSHNVININIDINQH